MKIIKGETGDWEIVVGMEVHAQVISESKLFSGAATAFGAEPNTQVSLVDAAMPGMLPVINQKAVEQAVRTGLGLNAAINERSVFDRKNYFYPDLPAGYQISQYKDPIVGEGVLTLDMPSEDGEEPEVREIGIERLHLEQDAGKSVHDMDPHRTYVDLNRAGVALMEIVSKPDIRGSEEAAAFLEKMRSILRYLGTCGGNMEQGQLRADVNVSVRKVGDTDFGTRCEIKNMNSLRFIRQAVEYEARRQVEILEDGGEIDQETRLFDPDRGETRAMRTKEEAHDYRYFPDPDLLPLTLERDWIEEIKATLPELPDAKRARFVSDFGLAPADAAQLVADRADADYFETVANGRKDPRLAATWVINELAGRLREREMAIHDSPVDAGALAGLLDLIEDNTISGRIAKDLLDDMLETGKNAAALVEEKGLKQISDTGEIEAILDQIIADNPKQVAQAKETPKVAGWFVGQVMKATGGKANPAVVNELLAKKLAE